MVKPIFEAHILVQSGVETYYFTSWQILEQSVYRTWGGAAVISPRQYRDKKPFWVIHNQNDSPFGAVGVHGTVVLYQKPFIEYQAVQF